MELLSAAAEEGGSSSAPAGSSNSQLSCVSVGALGAVMGSAVLTLLRTICICGLAIRLVQAGDDTGTG